MHSHNHSHHPSTTQKKKGNQFHNQSHDIFALDQWLADTRKASTVGPDRIRKRSQVQKICASELFAQVRIGSPKIANMLERVWSQQTVLLDETLIKLEHQVQVRDFAQTGKNNATFAFVTNFVFVLLNIAFFLLTFIYLITLFSY